MNTNKDACFEGENKDIRIGEGENEEKMRIYTSRE